MTLKSRLNKAERVAAILGQKNHPARIFVYYEGQEYGDLQEKNKEAERVKVADFLATARKEDSIMRVSYVDEKPITNIAGPGDYKKTVGIDLMKI